MSAIAAIFRRDRGPVSERALAALADRLAHRGPDGRDLAIEGAAGIAHLHAWVTPEEIGERQPLRSGGRLLAFDGRIDNRAELITALELERSDRSPSDAELALAAHEAWGEGFCRRLVGPYALALLEPAARRGFLARDPLGDRTLFYAELGAEIVISSEEASLLGHPGVSVELDESRLAHYFAAAVPGDGSTFFRGVTELLPGTLLRIGEGPVTAERLWSPPADGREAIRDGTALAEEYRELLTLAVESRLRSPAPAAVLMSGGLDSTSVAALAAESVDRRAEAQRPRSISWVFDSTNGCDEREFIRPVVERWRLDAREFRGDELGPLPDGRELCLNPSSPEENPYRRLKSRAYSEAVSAGSSVLLSGGSADALYTGYERWFADLIAAGRPVAAAGELLADLWRFGARSGLRSAGFGRWWRALRPRRPPPEWLTPWARGVLERQASRIEPADARLLAAAGPRPARGISLEIFYAGRCGVDLRHPYRDLRLVEFMLSLPAWELYRNGRFKEIARRALVGLLPEAVRTRTRRTSLTPLFDRALRGPNRAAWEGLLRSSGALWPRFVSSAWVEAALNRSAGSAGDVALWNCMSFELWRRRFGR